MKKSILLIALFAATSLFAGNKGDKRPVITFEKKTVNIGSYPDEKGTGAMGSKIRTETEITGWLPVPTPDNGFWGLTIERLQEGCHQEEHHRRNKCARDRQTWV